MLESTPTSSRSDPATSSPSNRRCGVRAARSSRSARSASARPPASPGDASRSGIAGASSARPARLVDLARRAVGPGRRRDPAAAPHVSATARRSRPNSTGLGLGRISTPRAGGAAVRRPTCPLLAAHAADRRDRRRRCRRGGRSTARAARACDLVAPLPAGRARARRRSCSRWVSPPTRPDVVRSAAGRSSDPPRHRNATGSATFDAGAVRRPGARRPRRRRDHADRLGPRIRPAAAPGGCAASTRSRPTTMSR